MTEDISSRARGDVSRWNATADSAAAFLPRARGCVKRNNGEIRRCSFPPTRGDLPTKARRTVTAERRVSHL